MSPKRMTNERRDLLCQLNGRIPLQIIVRFLQSKGTFNAVSAEKILSSPSNIAEKLVDLVMVRGNSAFDTFFLALIECKCYDLANELRPLVADEIVAGLENQLATEISGPSSLKYEESQNVASTYEGSLPLDVPLDFSVDLIDGDSPYVPQWDDYQKAQDRIYSHFTKPKGVALIISNHRFPSMPHRTGTDIDRLNLENLFRQLGYTVYIRNDLTSQEITKCVRDLATSRELLNTSSVVLAILTHGEHNCVLGVDEIPVDINRLLNLLNAECCPTMAGKPKLIFIQACRGERRDRGTDQPDNVQNRVETDMFRLFSCIQQTQGVQTRRQRVPNEADFLIAYATPPLYVSWRNTTRGSWFVQALCEIFSKHAKTDSITDMLTQVNRRVASFETGERYKQIPEYSIRLQKTFYFFPGLSRDTAV